MKYSEILPTVTMVIVVGITITVLATCISKDIKASNAQYRQRVQTYQEKVGTNISTFAETYGAPQKQTEVEDIKFYHYVIDGIYITVTVKNGIIVKVSE